MDHAARFIPNNHFHPEVGGCKPPPRAATGGLKSALRKMASRRRDCEIADRWGWRRATPSFLRMSLRFVAADELAVHDVEAEEVVEEGVFADQ